MRERLKLQPYADVSRQSGVTAFAIRPHSIVVRFQDDWNYEYTEQSAGARAVAMMKQLALSGRGLGTFITREVRYGHTGRFR